MQLDWVVKIKRNKHANGKLLTGEVVQHNIYLEKIWQAKIIIA
jgi:hypothetical protein